MTKYKINQLEKLGKKQKRWIIWKTENTGTIEIGSKVYGPTTLKNCENTLKKLKSRGA